MRLRLIGLSVSACIKDIIEGKVDEADVMAIMSGTDIRNDRHIETTLENYSKGKHSPWSKNPNYARELFMRLWHDGKIIQPRALNLEPLYVGARDHWAIQADLNTVKRIKFMMEVEEANYGKEHQGN